jgi:hypothetical protein
MDPDILFPLGDIHDGELFSHDPSNDKRGICPLILYPVISPGQQKINVVISCILYTIHSGISHCGTLILYVELNAVCFD